MSEKNEIENLLKSQDSISKFKLGKLILEDKTYFKTKISNMNVVGVIVSDYKNGANQTNNQEVKKYVIENWLLTEMLSEHCKNLSINIEDFIEEIISIVEDEEINLFEKDLDKKFKFLKQIEKMTNRLQINSYFTYESYFSNYNNIETNKDKIIDCYETIADEIEKKSPFSEEKNRRLFAKAIMMLKHLYERQNNIEKYNLYNNIYKNKIQNEKKLKKIIEEISLRIDKKNKEDSLKKEILKNKRKKDIEKEINNLNEDLNSIEVNILKLYDNYNLIDQNKWKIEKKIKNLEKEINILTEKLYENERIILYNRNRNDMMIKAIKLTCNYINLCTSEGAEVYSDKKIIELIKLAKENNNKDILLKLTRYFMKQKIFFAKITNNKYIIVNNSLNESEDSLLNTLNHKYSNGQIYNIENNINNLQENNSLNELLEKNKNYFNNGNINMDEIIAITKIKNNINDIAEKNFNIFIYDKNYRKKILHIAEKNFKINKNDKVSFNLFFSNFTKKYIYYELENSKINTIKDENIISDIIYKNIDNYKDNDEQIIKINNYSRENYIKEIYNYISNKLVKFSFEFKKIENDYISFIKYFNYGNEILNEEILKKNKEKKQLEDYIKSKNLKNQLDKINSSIENLSKKKEEKNQAIKALVS